MFSKLNERAVTNLIPLRKNANENLTIIPLACKAVRRNYDRVDMSIVSETVDLAITLYGTTEEATGAGSIAGANGFSIVSKETGREVWAIQDLDWDSVDHSWYRAYTANDQPAQIYYDDIHGTARRKLQANL